MRIRRRTVASRSTQKDQRRRRTSQELCPPDSCSASPFQELSRRHCSGPARQYRQKLTEQIPSGSRYPRPLSTRNIHLILDRMLPAPTYSASSLAQRWFRELLRQEDGFSWLDQSQIRCILLSARPEPRQSFHYTDPPYGISGGRASADSPGLPANCGP